MPGIKGIAMTYKSRSGAQKSGQAFIQAFYLGLFTIWSSFLAWVVVMQHRADLWPILATMATSMASHLALHCFCRSHLFTNTLLSLLFATLIGFSATWIACKQWHLQGWAGLVDHEQLMHKPWQGSHSLLCFCIGFFSFDALDLLHSSLHIHHPHTLLHHAIVVIGFSTALLLKVGFNYLVLTLICELHSIFAHLRRILRMVGLHQAGSLLVKGEWGLHWVAYLTTRLSLHLFISIIVILNGSKFSLVIEWPMILASILGINIMNVTLGFDLYKAFLKEAFVKGKSL